MKMVYTDPNDEDVILNAKKFLEILSKIKEERDCSLNNYRWIKTNSDSLENDIRNSLMKKYSQRETTVNLNDEKYIRLLTQQNILGGFADQLYAYSGGFNINCIKAIPRTEGFIREYLDEMDMNKNMKMKFNGNLDDIFIVHGRSEIMKISVARLLEQLNLVPIILSEQPNEGKTIIEKFEDHSEVNFAVILLSPDDIGYPKGKKEELKYRARQNVILELGYFIGKIGRENVAALFDEDQKDEFEFPTDIHGILYIPFDKKGMWKYKLIDELKASGFNISKDDISS